MNKWEKQNNKKTVSFLRILIRKVLIGKFQIVHFGWWSPGLKGRYNLSLSWNVQDEIEDEE